jgi:alkanesulfonate monooxygenase SsuD/methylene tetrahydromethanopterin reductase-like flavin-dependent oxidoreductase (luciferase family)
MKTESGAKFAKPLFAVSITPAATEVEKVFELAKIADNSAIDLVTIQDHPYLNNFLDAWTLLTSLATRTNRVKFMTNVADIPLRHPPILAKAAATLDILTGGRVELGLGAGALWKAIAGYGGPTRTPGDAVQATEEAIQVIRAIWGFDSDEKVVTFRGKFYNLEEAHPGPRPHHRIGIWLGAMGPRMLNVLGRLGDGWVAPLQSYLPTSKLLDAQRVIDASAVSTGRSPTSIRRGRNISGIIDDEGKYGKSLRGQGEAVVGSVDDWVEELAHYYNELRIDSFIFWPAEEGKEVDQVSLFADKVVPRVKQSLDR